MKLKVGGLYITRNGLYIVHIEMFSNSFLEYNYRGHIINPTDSLRLTLSWAQVTLSWTQDGKYDIKDISHDLNLVKEITDPVILAFYDT